MRRLGVVLVLMLGVMALNGCAPTRQGGFKPDAAFSGPRLTDHTFVSFDGAGLGLTRWEATGEPWAVIIGVHGMNDYANAFHMAGPWWAARGVTTLAYDQRGFGRSPGRGIWAPDALRVEDLRTITALARARWPHATLAVAGESLGGAIAIEAFASDRSPAADRLILLAPAVWGWSDQPLLNRVALVVAAGLAPGHVFTPPAWVTNHIWASDNISELYAMGADPLEILGARADALEGLVTTMQRAHREVAGLRPPVLYMYGAHDQVIPPSATLDAVGRLPAGVRTALYPRGWHLLLRDLHAETVWADALAFLRDPRAPLPSGAAPITASNLAKESRLREVQHPVQ
jgi:alpha-beta hydrolase superfamily lysophospholipase